MEIEPKTRKEQFLAKAAGQSIETPKPITREEMLLDAIAQNGGSGGGTGGLPFTEDDKKKLDSLTTPVIIQGTVTSREMLNNIQAKPGWVFFVRPDGASKSQEYIFTEKGEWDLIGDNSVDLSNYVKNTDYASNAVAGLVKAASGNGVAVDTNAMLFIAAATNEDINKEENARKPLVATSIPVFMKNYGILSRDQIPQMQSDIEGKVGFEDYAGEKNFGILKTYSGWGTTCVDGTLRTVKAAETEIKEESGSYKPLVPVSIPIFMSSYNIAKDTIPELQAQINAMTMGVGKPLEENQDLNDIKESGVYMTSKGSTTQSLLNCPYKREATIRLEVSFINVSTCIIQKLFPNHKAPTEFYIRVFNNSSWGNWFKFSGVEETDTSSAEAAILPTDERPKIFDVGEVTE